MISSRLSTTSDIDLSPEEISLLRDLIEERSGIHFEVSMWDSLKRKIDIWLSQKSFNEFKQYYKFLLTNDAEREFQELLDLITVQETYFFRDPWQFDFIKRKIIPEIIRRKIETDNKKVIKIWSAGCASGEEPYSLAIVLLELKELLKDFKLEILATDANSKALKKAREGIYTKKSFREPERAYLEKYFTFSGNNYYLHKEVKDMVVFSLLNLVKEPFPVKDLREQDLILCKNVIIYFKPHFAKRALHNIYQCLVEKGYLFMGASESLFYISHEFQLREEENVYYYVKEKGLSEIQERPKELMVTPQPKVPPVLPKPVFPRPPKPALGKEENPLSATIRCITEGDYEKAKEILNLISKENANSAEILVLLTYIHICLGELEDASRICHNLLRVNPLLVEGHLLLGLIYKYKEEPEKALMEFKKAIYIQPDLAFAHYYLGDLYLSTGEKDNAGKEYKNALTVFQKNTGGEKNLLGFVYGETELRQMIHICRQHLKHP